MAEEDGRLTVFWGEVSRITNHAVNILSAGNNPEPVIAELEMLERNVERAGEDNSLLDDASSSAILSQVKALLQEARQVHSSILHGETETRFRAPLLRDGPCRRAYHITPEQLGPLLDQHFSSEEIGKILGVSRHTVARRIRALFPGRPRFAEISDAALDVKVTELTVNKHIGPMMIQASLNAEGFHVQRQRVRESVQRVDPAGVAVRALTQTPIRRRLYAVAGPNSLWHIDGYHKLISWKIVIHGAIDGFSRLVVFMKAADNNQATTVLKSFMAATDQHGVPSRVRVDFGGENLAVVETMRVARGDGRGSAIQGKSVHNQRIERFWRDLWKDTVHMYYNMFLFLQTEGLLDRTDQAHMWLLHFIFLPRLNLSLQHQTNVWNHHKLRTEGFHTPNQLFTRGMLDKCHSSLTAVQDLFHGTRLEDLVAAGLPELHEPEPLFSCPLSAEIEAALRLRIDPTEQHSKVQYGLTLFQRAKVMIEEAS